MKPYLINLINALVLIIIGAWGYAGSDTPSKTALIPVFFGIVLLVITPQFRKGNKIIAHIAVLLTFFILIALIKPLTGAFNRHDSPAVSRVIVMMISGLFSMVIFVKSFVNARLKKE